MIEKKAWSFIHPALRRTHRLGVASRAPRTLARTHARWCVDRCARVSIDRAMDDDDDATAGRKMWTDRSDGVDVSRARLDAATRAVTDARADDVFSSFAGVR
jgi:hypothetical protein